MSLLRQRDFQLLLTGQTVSALGDWMGTFALMYFVLELSGSTTAVGGVLVLRLLPSAVGGPIAARVVARWNRRQVMLTSDLVRAGMAVALPLIPLLAWVYSWAFAIELVGLAFLPARDAAIPALIRRENDDDKGDDTGTLALANGFTMGTSYGMIPVGAGFFGLILLGAQHAGWNGHWKYVVIFWIDAVTYLVSYWAVRQIRGLESRSPAQQSEEHNARFVDALRLPLVRGVLPAVTVVALGLGSLFSLGVVFVRGVLKAGPVGFGALIACFGVGAAIGLMALRKRGRRDLLMQVRLGTAAQGIVIALMGLIASLVWAFLGAVLFGAAATTALIGGITYLQENHSGVRRNLALTAFHSTLRFGLSVAALGAGVAADLVGTVRLAGFSLAPAQTILIGSGLVVLGGSLLVHAPAGAAGAEAEAEARAEHRAGHAG